MFDEYIITNKKIKRLSKRQEFFLKIFRPKKYKKYVNLLNEEYRDMIRFYIYSNNYYHKIILSEINLFSDEIK